VKSQKEIEESFHAGQTRILEMVASDAPLPEILQSVVVLMKAQADGMDCSPPFPLRLLRKSKDQPVLPKGKPLQRFPAPCNL
jgi:hypothetical protein